MAAGPGCSHSDSYNAEPHLGCFRIATEEGDVGEMWREWTFMQRGTENRAEDRQQPRHTAGNWWLGFTCFSSCHPPSRDFCSSPESLFLRCLPFLLPSFISFRTFILKRGDSDSTTEGIKIVSWIWKRKKNLSYYNDWCVALQSSTLPKDIIRIHLLRDNLHFMFSLCWGLGSDTFVKVEKWCVRIKQRAYHTHAYMFLKLLEKF